MAHDKDKDNRDQTEKSKIRSVDLSVSTEGEGKNDSRNPTLTSSTATATAASSKATTVHRRVGKKSHYNKNHPSRQEKHAHKVREEFVPKEPISEKVVVQLRKLRPIIVRGASLLVTCSSSLATKCLKTLVSFSPQKERFWFFVPLFCICMDLFFLSMSIICSMVGKIVYSTLLLQKLAILELLEFDSATICYTLICFYPRILIATKQFFPFEEYWTVFLRWFAVDRLLCRPIKMKKTYLSKIKQENKMEEPARFSLRNVARFIIRHRGKRKEETERISMANQILLILRKIIPLILMIEVNVRRQGFLMAMSTTERILLSYGFAVIRSGYLFSPLIWMSWTLQLTVIMFAPSSQFWAYFLLAVGLSAIRLSHYTASVEDMEGLYVPRKDDKCEPQKMKQD